MYVREYMNTRVITTSSDALIHDAAKIMSDHKIRRLPVVDKGKLVGIITRDKIREIMPSQATSLSIWELNYLLAKMKVKNVMEKNVITVSPGTTVEEAAILGQKHAVGALPVMENKRVVGIVTTTTLYEVTTQALGFGKPGARLHILECDKTGSTSEVIDIINKSGVKILSLFHVIPPGIGREDCIIHLDKEDAGRIVNELKEKGYQVEQRPS
jgi:acetoin utilization protein AcuB